MSKNLTFNVVSEDASGDPVTDSSGNPAGNVLLPDGLGGLIAGENHPDSIGLGYLATRGKRYGTLIEDGAAVTVGGGVPLDTCLYGVRILANFTGNLVIAGFVNSAGTATSITLTTPTAGWYDFGDALNSGAALQFTAATAADDLLAYVVWSYA